MLKAIWSERRNNLAIGQSRNRCLIVSLFWQKLHLGLPFQFPLARLSFIRITPLWTNHMKILILSGTLIFHICADFGIGVESMICMYIDLTVKTPFVVNFQCTRSGRSKRLMSINLLTRCSQLIHLSPIKDLRNWIFRGVSQSIDATDACRCCAIWYNYGYWIAKGISPSQVSSENLVDLPSPMINLVLLKNHF